MTTIYESPFENINSISFYEAEEGRGALNSMPVQMHEPDSYFEFPEAEDEADQDVRGGMHMLAYAVLITMAACVVLGVLYAVYR